MLQVRMQHHVHLRPKFPTVFWFWINFHFRLTPFFEAEVFPLVLRTHHCLKPVRLWTCLAPKYLLRLNSLTQLSSFLLYQHCPALICSVLLRAIYFWEGRTAGKLWAQQESFCLDDTMLQSLKIETLKHLVWIRQPPIRILLPLL